MHNLTVESDRDKLSIENQDSSLQFVATTEYRYIMVSNQIKKMLDGKYKNKDIINTSRKIKQFLNKKDLNVTSLSLTKNIENVYECNVEKEQVTYSKDGNILDYTSIRNLSIDGDSIRVGIESHNNTNHMKVFYNNHEIDLAIKTIEDGTYFGKRKPCQADWEDITLSSDKNGKDTITFIKREYETDYWILEEETKFRYKGFEDKIRYAAIKMSNYINNELKNTTIGKKYTNKDKNILVDNIKELLNLYNDMELIAKPKK